MAIKKSLPPHSSQVTGTRYCYLENRIAPAKELKVACAGRENCEPGYLVERDGFPCFGMEFVADGTGQLVLNGRSYPLRSGLVFCYGPGVSQRIHNDAGRPMTKYFVDFFGREAGELFRGGDFGPGAVVEIPDAGTFRFLFDQLLAEGSGDARESAGICAAYLRLMLMKAAGGITPALRTSPAALAQFHRCIDLIDTRYLELRDLNDVAAALNTRPAQLCRVFKQSGRPGPFQYLIHKKMNHAAELLVAGRKSVKETAFMLGYEDPYHFSRLFKRHFGQSPAHFQRMFHRD